MNRNARTTVLVGTVSLFYATLRYNVFKGVAWSDWPVYILNKALALSIVLLLLVWVVRGHRRRDDASAGLLTIASRGVWIHVVLSLAILTPEYFPAFFSRERLTWQAGTSMLAGALAATALSLALRREPLERETALMAGVVAFAGGTHAMLFGYRSWFDPGTWPGGMFPITMLSFAAGAAALAVVCWPRQRRAIPDVPPEPSR